MYVAARVAPEVNAREIATVLYAAAEAVDTNAVVEEEPVQEEAAPPAPAEEAEEAPQEFTQVIKQKFIEGGPGFMSIVLLALVLGLAICIERIIYLALSNSNAKSLLFICLSYLTAHR